MVAKVVRMTSGVVFLLIGLVGIILPILHGTLFVALAIILFSYDIPWCRKLVTWIQGRFPFTRKWYERGCKWMKKHGLKPPPSTPPSLLDK